MTPLRERLKLLRRLRALIVSEASSLAAASAHCRKRPMEECLTAEVIPLTEAVRFLEQNAERVLKPRRLGVRRRHRG